MIKNLYCILISLSLSDIFKLKSFIEYFLKQWDNTIFLRNLKEIEEKTANAKESAIFDLQQLTDWINSFLQGSSEVQILKALILIDLGIMLLILAILYVLFVRHFISERLINYIFSKITFISKDFLEKIKTKWIYYKKIQNAIFDYIVFLFLIILFVFVIFNCYALYILVTHSKIL